MFSSEFIRAGFFKPRKADCERRLRACDEQDRNAVHREQPSNLRMRKLTSSTKKPHHTTRGAVWGGLATRVFKELLLLNIKYIYINSRNS